MPRHMMMLLPTLLLSAAAAVASAGGPATDLGMVGSSDAAAAAGTVVVRGAEELWALIEQVIPPDEARQVMSTGLFQQLELPALDLGEGGTVGWPIRVGTTHASLYRSLCRLMGYELTSDECQGVRNYAVHAIGYLPRLSHGGLPDWTMGRRELLRLLQLMYPHQYTRFLEIGCGHMTTPDIVDSRAAYRQHVCVDPVVGGTHRMTSDEFFAHNTQLWDVIFVDGLHLEEQVLTDMHNALRWLAPGGTIVMHDCVPRSPESAGRANSIGTVGAWNGDVWKAVLRLRAMRGLELVVVDIDEGCGLVRKLPNRRPLPAWRYLEAGADGWPGLEYEVDLMDQEAALLQLKTVADAVLWLEETAVLRDRAMDHTTIALTAATHTAANNTTAKPAHNSSNTTSSSSNGAGDDEEEEEYVEFRLWSRLHRLPPGSASSSFQKQCFALLNQHAGCRDLQPLVQRARQQQQQRRGRQEAQQGEEGEVLDLDGEEGGLVLRVPRSDLLLPLSSPPPPLVFSTWLWDERGNATCCTTATTLLPLQDHEGGGGAGRQGLEEAATPNPAPPQQLLLATHSLHHVSTSAAI